MFSRQDKITAAPEKGNTFAGISGSYNATLEKESSKE